MIRKQPFGQTGHMSSATLFGGASLGRVTQKEADNVIDELLRYSDRIIVFFSGAVFKIVDAAGTDGEELGYLIGGRERA